MLKTYLKMRMARTRVKEVKKFVLQNNPEFKTHYYGRVGDFYTMVYYSPTLPFSVTHRVGLSGADYIMHALGPVRRYEHQGISSAAGKIATELNSYFGT